VRNIELHWLLSGLAPNYRSIADFRKLNPKALNGLNHDGLQHETGDEHPGHGKTDRKAQNLEAEL